MILNRLQLFSFKTRNGLPISRNMCKAKLLLQSDRSNDTGTEKATSQKVSPVSFTSSETTIDQVIPKPRVVPMVLTNKEPIALSFDDVPGPRSLKYLSTFRQYFSEVGTQVMAGLITFGLSVGTYITERKPLKDLSTLFDEYGPVVRFISPVGGDIVLLNNPDHIQKVYALEGEYPVRSALDSLEKYRTQHKNHIYRGLYSTAGQEWLKQRSAVATPLSLSVAEHMQQINFVCDSFTEKINNIRNHHDEVPKDLYTEIHKWTFDTMGLILFSKRFTMLDTETVYSQCDMSWLYQSLVKATDAIIKCESGLQLWKIFTTPAWHSLVKHCDNMDSLIGKQVIEAEHKYSFEEKSDAEEAGSLIMSLLVGEEKMSAEDVTTILMDMLLIGVNTITSTMSFLLYNLAKHQRAQKFLYKELENSYPKIDVDDVTELKERTPYLQACIKETLRIVPPIPVLTRILPKNVILDRYNIPRGTLIIMSMQEASLKESNYDDATKFWPERWLTAEAKDYHTFSSIPFGFGARKCLGQNIAETMLSLLTVKILQKYKLEYHYGDINPTRSFIAKPNKALKIRFIDRV